MTPRTRRSLILIVISLALATAADPRLPSDYTATSPSE